MANYSYFRTGQIRTENGTDVPIGTITLGTGHAGDGIGSIEAMAHYDNTGTGMAYVACGDDEFGIWVAGSLKATATEDQIQELRAASLSGDWREIRGNLELVGILAVNVPGFPVPRLAAMVASGRCLSLVASASFCEITESIELTREEKIAIRGMITDWAGRNTDVTEIPTPKDVFGAETAQVDAPEHIETAPVAVAERIARAEQVKRAARAAQVKSAVKGK